MDKNKKSGQGSKAVAISLFLVLIFLITAGYYLYRTLNRETVSEIPVSLPVNYGGRKQKVKIYFGSPDALNLISEEREIYLTDREEDQVKQVIYELIKGPKEDLTPVFPPNSELREVFIADRVAYLDFNRSFKEEHPGGSSGELVTIYGIVNTVVDNFSGIDKVQILVEGQEIDTLAGHISADHPLARRQIQLRIAN